MSEKSIRNETDRLKREVSRLERDRSTAQGKSGGYRRDAGRLLDSIRASTSESQAKSKRRQAEQKGSYAEKENKKVADLGKKIRDKEARISALETRLQTEIDRRRKADERDKKRRHDKERAHQQKLLREREAADRRRRLELRQQRQLSSEIEERVEKYSSALGPALLRNLPTVVKALLVASDPSDLERLDLAHEVRQINRRIERAKHRDAVKLEYALAAQPSDLIHELNKHSPTILHFSGHGSARDGLAFRDAEGHTKLVAPEALATTITAAADSVKLIVLNSCESGQLAASLVESVDLAIGMAESINDESAEIFAARLYGSIADGLSVQRAFGQACAELKLEGAPDSEVPQLYARDGIDPDEVVLVRPPEELPVPKAA